MLRAEPVADRTLFIAGADEFIPRHPDRPKPSIVFADDLLTAYEMLDYNRVYISEQENNWFSEYAHKPEPASFKTVGQHVVTDTFMIGGNAIGVVQFPYLPFGQDDPTFDMIQEVVSAAKALKPSVKLVVGISNWGRRCELNFLTNTDPVLDILLGAGPGRGMKGELAGKQKHTFWTRSERNGKYMNVINVLAWPTEASEKNWTIGQNITDSVDPLTFQIASHPDYSGLFEDKQFKN